MAAVSVKRSIRAVIIENIPHVHHETHLHTMKIATN